MRVGTLALISAFFVTGCSGGGNVAPIAAVAPSAHTSRMESLPGNGARLFIDGVLVDTITYAADGAAQHDFGNGKTVTDKVPVSKGGMHTEAAHVCQVHPADQGTIDAYNRAVTAYNQATLTLYIAVGVAAATTVITSGLAFAVLAAGSMGAVYGWETARTDMYAAHAEMSPYYVC